MPTNFYDVIVLGDELAGLWAATLCARRGLRVLVAETPGTAPEKYTIGPYVLPRAPLPFILEPSPAFRRVVAELSFIQTVKRRLTSLRPAFQVVLPDARIDVWADADAFARELDRELPRERAAIEAFGARAQEISRVLDPVLGQDISIPPEGFWEKRELRYSDAKLPAEEDPLPGVAPDHPARALVALPAAFTTALDPRALTLVPMARAFDLWRRAAARLEGGRDALRQMLIEKLRTQHAGELRTAVPAGIVMRWGKVQGVTLAGRGETLGANAVLCASPAADIVELFDDKAPKRLLQLAREIRPTAYRYVLHLVVAEAGVPEGIAPVVFACFDPSRPLLGDNALAIHVAPPDDEARVLVTVVANAPAPGPGETLGGVFAELRSRLRRRIEEILPFSSEHTVLVHSPNETVPPQGFETSDSIPLFPAEPLWTSSLPAALGVGAAPYEIGIKNVFAASTQNLPGLGLEGELAAAWCAARALCAASGKKKDYLKDEVLFG